MDIVFWQRMFSPHMMGLAEAVADRGANVIFVAAETLSQERRKQGWQQVPEGKVLRRIIKDKVEAEAFVKGLPDSTVHISQGLRGNAEMRVYQDIVIANKQSLWIIMETVDEDGWRAPLKKAIYRWEIFKRHKDIAGILAIGAGTADWLSDRGFPSDRVFPFAYFISSPEIRQRSQAEIESRPFTFSLVGNLEHWKNPILAMDAFKGMSSGERKLSIVGDGSLLSELECSAKSAPPEANIEFWGRLQMDKVLKFLSDVDCLILPSNVDGWGVVASEAMLVGTPAIVSDACGVKSAVQLAPFGGVFPAGDVIALQALMERIQLAGRDVGSREELKNWAFQLSASFGAEYLEKILSGLPCSNSPRWLRRVGG